MVMKMAKKIVRVLVDQDIGGQSCKCGELISAESNVLAALIKSKQVDDSDAGIEYAKEQGAGVKEIGETNIEQADIVAAISLVDQQNPELWTADEKPTVQALESILQKQITVEQRDEAFSVFIQS